MHPTPMDKAPMLSVSLDDDAREWAERLEDRESANSGLSLALARQRVGRRIGVAVGTLENLRRGRLKGLKTQILERIRVAFITDLETQIKALSNDLENAKKCTVGNGGVAFRAAEAALDHAKEAIKALRKL